MEFSNQRPLNDDESELDLDTLRGISLAPGMPVPQTNAAASNGAGDAVRNELEDTLTEIVDDLLDAQAQQNAADQFFGGLS